MVHTYGPPPQDQCFFGAPAVLDKLLIDTFQLRYPRVYAEVHKAAVTLEDPGYFQAQVKRAAPYTYA